jgi:DNA repair exonuclease SbcCD ATPase subunit
LKGYRKHGSIEQQFESIRQSKNELLSMRKEYEAYDLLMKCFHSDGIPFQIIKRKLPYINSEIAKVLANVVNFTVFFENEEDRLNLYIKHQNFDARPLEMGSGAEKVLASLAIRMGLIKISNLPKSNFLVLDEPALSLDSNILESFSRLLDVLKENFQVVFLISHLEMLKDFADTEIVIDSRNKFAYVNQ